LTDFDRALELDPDDVSLYGDRGHTHRNMGNYSAAIKDISKALSKQPSYADLYNRGLSYAAYGNRRRAIVDFREGLRLAALAAEEGPNHFRVQLDIALFHLALGAEEESLKLYRALVSKNLRVAWLLEAVDNLEQYMAVMPQDGTAPEAAALVRASLSMSDFL
jgi:tetratricopeptide (TPR) repeat protein